jgi:hypothetical protein
MKKDRDIGRILRSPFILRQLLVPSTSHVHLRWGWALKYQRLICRVTFVQSFSPLLQNVDQYHRDNIVFIYVNEYLYYNCTAVKNYIILGYISASQFYGLFFYFCSHAFLHCVTVWPFCLPIQYMLAEQNSRRRPNKEAKKSRNNTLFPLFHYYNGWSESFQTQCWFIFGSLKSVFSEWKAMD